MCFVIDLISLSEILFYMVFELLNTYISKDFPFNRDLHFACNFVDTKIKCH